MVILVLLEIANSWYWPMFFPLQAFQMHLDSFSDKRKIQPWTDEFLLDESSRFSHSVHC